MAKTDPAFIRRGATRPSALLTPRPRAGRTLRRASGRAAVVALAVVSAAGVAAALQSAASASSPRTRTARAAATAGGEWTTYGGSSTRDSVQAAGPSLRPLRARWRSPGLDGAIYGEPLIFDHEVLVATEADTVYALAASSGRIIWSRHLGVAVPAGALPCGDISPTVGITSTMVLDPASGELFASAATDPGGAVHHVLVALRPSTGALLWQRDLDRPGWDAAAELQRPALALSAGRVVVGFGGNYGDCGRYHGYVMSVPETGVGPTAVFRVPTSREGAVWAPAGLSVDAAGDVLAVTGNGASTSRFDGGDAVFALSPTMRKVSFFAPSNWAQDNGDDGDLGSGPATVLPGGRVFVVGKEQTGYLLDANRLGGIGGQLASAEVCFSIGGDAYLAPFVYVSCPNVSLTAVSAGTASLRVAWRAPGGLDGSPTIAGGLVWLVSGDQLSGLALRSGRVVVSRTSIPVEHYVAPAAGEGLLVVGGTDRVEAFEGPSGYRP